MIKTNIYEDSDTGVALHREIDREAASIAKGHSQPADFKGEDLKYLLGSIRYKEKGLFGWSETRQVFSAYGLYRLTPYLLEGFARATPDDEVFFHLSTVKHGSIVGSRRFTDGAMFVKEGKLHCLFSNIDIRPDITDIYDGSPHNYYGGAFWKLVSNDWQNLAEGVKGTHYNWIVLDIEKGLQEKRQRDKALIRRIKREKVIKPKKQQKESGWEDWAPGKTLEGISIDR